MEVLKNDSLCVEHIGSTSVMGLGAKPIVNIVGYTKAKAPFILNVMESAKGG